MKKFWALILSMIFAVACLSFTACGKEESKEYSFVAPDGAPALAIAKFISDKENFGLNASVNYSVTNADNIGLALSKNTGDFVIAPVNLASKLYDAGNESYKMVSVITHGNLYILSKTQISVQDLKGKVIGAIGKGAVPGLTLSAVLEKNGLEYVESDVPVSDKVAVRYFSQASDLIPQLKTGKLEIGLLPEPAATNLTKMASDFAYRLDVQELYDAETKAYPQAVLMVKTSILNENSNLVETLKNKFDLNVEWVKNNTESAVNAVNGALVEGITASLKATAINEGVVDNCKIYWQSSLDAVTSVTNYINDLIALNSASAKAVTVNFFA